MQRISARRPNTSTCQAQLRALLALPRAVDTNHTSSNWHFIQFSAPTTSLDPAASPSRSAYTLAAPEAAEVDIRSHHNRHSGAISVAARFARSSVRPSCCGLTQSFAVFVQSPPPQRNGIFRREYIDANLVTRCDVAITRPTTGRASDTDWCRCRSSTVYLPRR